MELNFKLKHIVLVIFQFLWSSLLGTPQEKIMIEFNGIESDSIRLVYIYKVVDYYYNRNEDLFFKYLKDYENLALKFNSNIELACAYRRYANFYVKKQYYKKSLEYATKALQLDLKSKYRLGITSDYITIADIYTIQGDYKTSLELFNETLFYYNNLGIKNFDHGKGTILYHKADVLYKMNRYKEALTNIDKAVRNFNSKKNYSAYFNEPKNRDPLLAKSYLIKTKILQGLGLKEKIPEVLNSVSVLLNKWDLLHEQIEYNWIKCNYEFKEENKINLEEIEINLTEVKEEKLFTYVINYYSLLKEYYEDQNNHRIALQISDSIAVYQSKIHKIENIDTKNKYLAQFETKKAKYESAQLILEKENETQKVFIFIGLFMVTLIFLILIFINLETSKKSHKKTISLKDLKIDELLRENELENLQGLLAGQDVERKRIAQDLHDTIGGMLATVKLHFNALGKSKDLKGDNAEIFTNADNLLDESCKEVRRVSHDLNTGSASSYGLKENLKTLKNALELTSEVKVNVIADEFDLPTLSPIEKELFKVIQELLSNTLKHAKATEINIQLSQFEDEIQLMFEDNGIGFNVNKITRGLGLESIQKRIAKLQGTLTIDSHERSGTTFIFEIPVKS